VSVVGDPGPSVANGCEGFGGGDSESGLAGELRLPLGIRWCCLEEIVRGGLIRRTVSSLQLRCGGIDGADSAQRPQIP
jgi:hypothetical protein